MDNYDVIVVGAGPAGGQCARELAKANLKVILLEKEKEIGEPNFSTAGTIAETIETFGIPQEVAPYKWSGFHLNSAGVEFSKRCEKNFGFVFDFRRLKQFLAEEAADNGGEIAVGVTVEDLIIEENKIVGVKYRGIVSAGEMRAKVVVDATGGASILASKVGLINEKKKLVATGLELEMTNVKLPEAGTLYFYLGDKYIPNGYGWVFPLSDEVSKVGIGRYNIDSNKNLDLKEQFKKFIGEISFLKEAQPLEFHAGSLTFEPSIKNFVKDGFIAIGSAATLVNPLGGEGIRHGMHSARFAAETIKMAFEKNDFSERSLSHQNELWADYARNAWYESYLLAKKVYSNTEDSVIDSYFNLLKDFTGDGLFDLLFNYNFEKYIPNIVKRYGRNKFGDLLRAIGLGSSQN